MRSASNIRGQQYLKARNIYCIFSICMKHHFALNKLTMNSNMINNLVENKFL